MAVKAEFQADFASFYAGVDKAVAKTGEFERAAKKADGATKQWSGAFGQADSVLQQMGVNVGGAGRALDEISNAAGKSATEIGLVGSAALVAGAAMAGWNFGRAIAGWLDLDKAIAAGTATLLGWGDVIAQTSSAQTDTINAAIRNGAAATISYSEAIKFNTEFHKKRLAVVKESNKADEDTKAAMVELNSAGSTLQGTLEGMSGTVVEAVKHYLDAGVSQSALATAYGLTATQVKAVASSVAAEAEITKKAAADKLAAEKALAEFRDSAHSRQLEILNIQKAESIDSAARVNQAVVNELNARIKLNEALGLDAQGRLKVTSAAETLRLELEELHKTRAAGISQSAQEQVLMDQYTDALLQEALAQDAATAALSKAPAAIDATAAAHDRASKSAGVYMNQLHMLVDDPKLAAFFGGNAAAVGFYGGGHGGFTPEEAAAMGAGQFINFAGSGLATGRTFGAPVTINIHQPLGTPTAIARAVGDAMTGQARATGARL